MTEIRPSEERGSQSLQEGGGLAERIADNTSRREAFRYLGYRGNTPDEAAGELMESCIQELCTKLSPRFFAREYPLSCTEEGDGFYSGVGVKCRVLGRIKEGLGEDVL